MVHPGYLESELEVYPQLRRPLLYRPADLDAKNQIVSFNPSDYNPAQAVRLYTEAINPATGKVNAYDPVTKTYLPPVYYGAIVPGSGNPNNGFVVANQNGYPRGLYQNRDPIRTPLEPP